MRVGRYKKIVGTLCLLAIATQLLFVAQSCNNPHLNPFAKEKIKVIGRLVANCDNPSPINGRLVILETAHTSGLLDKIVCKNTYKEVSKTYTNSNGDFEFEYDDQECIAYMQISIQDTVDNGKYHLPLMIYVPGKRNINAGIVYLQHIKKYQYEIKTQQPYTASDTLFYNLTYTYRNGKNDSNYTYIVGPFSNGQTLSGGIIYSDKQVLDAKRATENKKYNLENNWLLKSNGKQAKRSSSNVLVNTPCETNAVIIDLDE